MKREKACCPKARSRILLEIQILLLRINVDIDDFFKKLSESVIHVIKV